MARPRPPKPELLNGRKHITSYLTGQAFFLPVPLLKTSIPPPSFVINPYQEAHYPISSPALKIVQRLKVQPFALAIADANFHQLVLYCL